MTKTTKARAIRAVFIEDSLGYASALEEFIRCRSCGVQFLASYGTAEEALADLEGKSFDVAVVDINLPQMGGIEFVLRLRKVRPAATCLMLTMHDEGEKIFDAMKAGASGYLLKSASASEIMEAIKEVAAGGSPMSSKIARRVVDFFHEDPKNEKPLKCLTPRELTVLELLAKGAMYKEISDLLDIRLSTVQYHVGQIYEKLHVHSRTEATLKYLGRKTEDPPR